MPARWRSRQPKVCPGPHLPAECRRGTSQAQSRRGSPRPWLSPPLCPFLGWLEDARAGCFSKGGGMGHITPQRYLEVMGSSAPHRDHHHHHHQGRVFQFCRLAGEDLSLLSFSSAFAIMEQKEGLKVGLAHLLIPHSGWLDIPASSPQAPTHSWLLFQRQQHIPRPASPPGISPGPGNSGAPLAYHRSCPTCLLST